MPAAQLGGGGPKWSSGLTVPWIVLVATCAVVDRLLCPSSS
jgi:hypothetical protein